jgi:hypothetical protein
VKTPTTYTTQAEAEREIRIALWGDVSFARRPTLFPEPGTLGIVVAADVNGRTVAFTFDNWGRRVAKPLVLAKKGR